MPDFSERLAKLNTVPPTEGRPQPEYEGPAIVEIMGHQRLAGSVREVVIGGAPMLRVDVPQIGDVAAFTQYLGGGALFRLTPVSEDLMRRIAVSIDARPVSAWDLRDAQTAFSGRYCGQQRLEHLGDDKDDEPY